MVTEKYAGNIKIKLVLPKEKKYLSDMKGINFLCQNIFIDSILGCIQNTCHYRVITSTTYS